MLDTQPLDYLPIWGVYLLTVVLLYLSIEAGYRFSIFSQKRWPDHAESGVGSMVFARLVTNLPAALAFTSAATSTWPLI